MFIVEKLFKELAEKPLQGFFLSWLNGNLGNLEKLCYIFLKLKYKWNVFFIPEFERAAKIRKIAVYRFLISLLVPEL